jgi:hypothetical protein
MIGESKGSLMPQRRSLSLVMAEGQLEIAKEQLPPVGMLVIGGAVMSRFGRRPWREVDVSSGHAPIKGQYRVHTSYVRPRNSHTHKPIN